MLHVYNWILINIFVFLISALMSETNIDVFLYLLSVASSGLVFLAYLQLDVKKSHPKDKESLNKYTKLYRIAFHLIILMVLVFSLKNPELIFLIPAILYFMEDRKDLLIAIPILARLIFQEDPPLQFLQIILYLGLCVMSIWLRRISEKLVTYREKVLKTTDEAESNIQLLKRKNQQNLENYEINRQNDILQERNRIAREIHDNVGHKLTSAILQVSALEMVNEDHDYSQVKETLETAMTDIRSSIHALHDTSLSIENELHAMADSYLFCPVHLDIEIQKEPDANKHYAILLVCREALSNTARHSNASRIDISLKQWGHFYNLIIADNGSKIDKDKKANPDGIGLVSMEERIVNLAGRIHFNNQNGFHIFIQMPI